MSGMTDQFIDTHAHLQDESFRGDLPEVLERARAAGVVRIITIGTTAASSAQAVELAMRHASVAAAIGLQPNELSGAGPRDWDAVRELGAGPRVVAIGETGLDRHWDFTPFDRQEEFFARHLELARERQKPLVIHCREAEADIVRMLRVDYDRHGPVRGVMHSFTGDAQTAQACLEMGLFISFAGMVTYKSAANLREVARCVSRERILIETDSPYLAPVPVRGKRNEPAFVVHTAAALAQLFEMDLSSFAALTTKNAQALFGAGV